MEEIKVKKKKSLFSRFEWICIIIFAVFGIVGLILHFLGYDDIKGNAAEAQILASQTDYLLVSKNDPYIMIGTPDPDGELETTVLKVDSFGFYNYFKAPADLIIDPFHSAFVGWNTLYNAIMGVSNTTINDGSSLLRYRMSAGNLNEFTGYMPVTTISHQDYNIVKGCIYAEGGGYAWLSTSNFVKSAPVPRISGDLINAYYFYVWEGDSSHYYAVTTTGALHLHRASSSDAASRIVYRDGMMLYSYESGAWQGPIGASQSMLDGLGLPYIMNFENAAGMVMYDDACMAAVWMQSFSDQQTSVTPTPTSAPVVNDIAFSFFVHGKPFWSQTLVPNIASNVDLQYYLVDVYASDMYNSLDISFQGNTALAVAMSEYGVSPPWVRPSVVKSYSSTDLALYIYFSGNLYSLKIYNIGSVLPTHNMDFIRANYIAIDWNINTEYNSSFYAGADNGLNCVSMFLTGSVSNGTNQTPAIFDLTLPRYGSIELPNRPFYNAEKSVCFNYTSSYVNNALTQGYRVGLDYSLESDITPTPSPSPSPDPDAPSPTLTPTPAPHVIVTWPTPTPTPTPVVKLDPVFPSSMPPLNSVTVNSVLESGNTYLDNNNAITVLSRALAFVPNTVLSLWWFWLFVLVILAGIRVFIHFF